MKVKDKKMRVKDGAKRVINAIRKNIATAILAAFAFIIALVWRDAIQEGVNALVVHLDIPKEGYIFNLIAAIIVTIICVVGILIVSKWAEKK